MSVKYGITSTTRMVLRVAFNMLQYVASLASTAVMTSMIYHDNSTHRDDRHSTCVLVPEHHVPSMDLDHRSNIKSTTSNVIAKHREMQQVVPTDILTIRMVEIGSSTKCHTSKNIRSLYNRLDQVDSMALQMFQRGYDATDRDMSFASMLRGVDTHMDWYCWVYMRLPRSSIESLQTRLSHESVVYTMDFSLETTRFTECDLVVEQHGRRVTDVFGANPPESVRIVVLPDRAGTSTSLASASASASESMVSVQCIVYRAACSLDTTCRLMAAIVDAPMTLRQSSIAFETPAVESIKLACLAYTHVAFDRIRYAYDGYITKRNEPHGCWHHRYRTATRGENVMRALSKLTSTLFRSKRRGSDNQCVSNTTIYTIAEYLHVPNSDRFNSYTYKVHKICCTDADSIYAEVTKREECVTEAFTHHAVAQHYSMFNGIQAGSVQHTNFSVQIALIECDNERVDAMDLILEWHEHTNTACIVAIHSADECVLLLTANSGVYDHAMFTQYVGEQS